MPNDETKVLVCAALADQLRAFVERHGISAFTLAARINVTEQYAAKLLRGEGFPSPAVLWRLRRVVRLNLNALLDQVPGDVPSRDPTRPKRDRNSRMAA